MPEPAPLDVSHLPPALLSLGDDVSTQDWLWQLGDVEAADIARTSCAVTHFWVTGRAHAIAQLEANAERFMRAGLAWLGAHADHPWNRPPQTQTQIWISRGDDRPPTPAGLRPLGGYWGNGVFRPTTGGIWTSTKLSESFLPWLPALLPGPRASLWQLTPEGTPRLYTVATADDWHDLVVAYPQRVETQPVVLSSEVALPGPLYLPAWERVAGDWDAVHFTMGGKLRAMFQVRPVLDGFTVLHEECGIEETLWFRWTFADPIPLAIPEEPQRRSSL